MIPYAFKILQPQRVVPLIIFVLVMFQLIVHTSGAQMSAEERHSCNKRPMKRKMFYSTMANQYLAVKNGIVTTVAERHQLYTINGPNKDPEFFIYDPKERKFICHNKKAGVNSKKRRFVAKDVPRNPEDCLFNERSNKTNEYYDDGTVQLIVKGASLMFNKNGNQIKTKLRHSKSHGSFVAQCMNDNTAESCMSFKPKRSFRQIKDKRYRETLIQFFAWCFKRNV